MNKPLLSGILAMACCVGASAETLNVMNEAVFYDGYQTKIIYDADLADGILRLSNSTYSVKLTDEQLSKIGDKLDLQVIIGALCDNYDRMGTINLVLVPKGATEYQYDDVSRIEIARLITPFMDKNKQPDHVPYDYNIDAVSFILRDANLKAEYDFWIEAEIFGVPYAANQQIRGCADRNDTFTATINFITEGNTSDVTNHILIPIYTKRPEVEGPVNLNNYREEATDTIGKTTRTWRFTLDRDVSDARITFINTNHGANLGGEEYIRRKHLVIVDGELMLRYFPGGVSCEPYREYNTQANGIYGRTPMSDSEWMSFSNWCPGQAVPIREIELGAMQAGEHEIMVRVPSAKFKDKEGDFRPSLYVQAVTEGSLPAGILQPMIEKGNSINMKGNELILGESASELLIYSVNGSLVYGRHNPAASYDMSAYEPGIYIVILRSEGRDVAFRKVLVK